MSDGDRQKLTDEEWLKVKSETLLKQSRLLCEAGKHLSEKSDDLAKKSRQLIDRLASEEP